METDGMNSFLHRLAGPLLFALVLGACAALPADLQAQERDYFPGGFPFYSYGTSQSKENFANIARAQDSIALYRKQITWDDIRPGMAPGSINMLQAYFPLSVRWQLKDGRQFIAEHIDVRAIMRDYFKTHEIRMPWQIEGRSWDKSGDYGPSLVIEVKDDAVILKWLIRTNHTPVNERFTSTGAANWWHVTKEEFIVTSIQGTPTSGINFDKRIEIVK
jgi:hypothetical protein